MPIYEYICRKCEHEFTLLMPVEMRDQAVCPRCGAKEDVQRVISACSVLSKQGGSSCQPPAGSWRGG
ncbi:MAG: FmdB family zinc ribbon protein [Bacillota bacterium]|uniref:FmdB family zinc ribbon protein n=1 Tax=Desulfurispora thermophila TaxID=265470 RepID=UPI0003A4B4ED|nr:zinc ribbon domain-containing protein [Desulfurispora thermophila]